MYNTLCSKLSAKVCKKFANFFFCAKPLQCDKSTNFLRLKSSYLIFFNYEWILQLIDEKIFRMLILACEGIVQTLICDCTFSLFYSTATSFLKVLTIRTNNLSYKKYSTKDSKPNMHIALCMKLFFIFYLFLKKHIN